MSLQLWPFQHDGLTKVASKFKNGVNRQVVKLPTGMGKTPLFANLHKFIPSNWKRHLLVVHREELAQQAADTVRKWNPGVKVGVEMGDLRSNQDDDYVVAGVRTVGNTGSPRLTQFNPEKFISVGIDECFPAGTDIDGRCIEQVSVGDYVSSSRPGDCAIERKQVTRVFKNRPLKLLTVYTAVGAVTCTPGHPFLTHRGWVVASKLKQGKDRLLFYGVFNMRGRHYQPHKIPERQVKKLRACVLLTRVFKYLLFKGKFDHSSKDKQEVCFGSNDSKQSNEKVRNTRQAEGDAKTNQTQTDNTGWQWTWTDSAREALSREDRAIIPDSGSYKDAARKWLSYLLQTGLGKYISKARCGDRWRFARSDVETRTGHEKGRLPKFVRVDSISIHEPGCDGTFGGLCPDGYVYNLEVADYHNYIANGFLVHNCHHATAQSYQTILKHFKIFDRKDILLLGVTATPNRSDGSPLGAVFEEIVFEKTILEGINEGWLANLRGVKIVTGENLDDIHKSMGDFNNTELAGKVNTARMNDLAVRSWQEHGEGRQTVEFCVDVKHAIDLATTYKGYGIPAEAIWAADPLRADKLAAHRAGLLKVICNCEILIEGYDDWRIGCIGLDRPTQSELLYTQMIGRGTRIDPSTGNLVLARGAGLTILKEDCIILDRVLNTSKHSLVTLASLFGLGVYTDLKKRGMAKIMEEVAELKAANPALDLSGLLDVGELKSYAKAVDMFAVSYPPEIEKLSPYQWRKVDGAYVLLLHNKSSITVLPDLLDKWNVVGFVNGYKVNEKTECLEDAIKAADQSVKDLGTRETQLLAKRVLKTDAEKPTPAQLGLCKKLHIPVPANATKGEVRRKIGQVLQDRTRRKVA